MTISEAVRDHSVGNNGVVLKASAWGRDTELAARWRKAMKNDPGESQSGRLHDARCAQEGRARYAERLCGFVLHIRKWAAAAFTSAAPSPERPTTGLPVRVRE